MPPRRKQHVRLYFEPTRAVQFVRLSFISMTSRQIARSSILETFQGSGGNNGTQQRGSGAQVGIDEDWWTNNNNKPTFVEIPSTINGTKQKTRWWTSFWFNMPPGYTGYYVWGGSDPNHPAFDSLFDPTQSVAQQNDGVYMRVKRNGTQPPYTAELVLEGLIPGNARSHPGTWPLRRDGSRTRPRKPRSQCRPGYFHLPVWYRRRQQRAPRDGHAGDDRRLSADRRQQTTPSSPSSLHRPITAAW